MSGRTVIKCARVVALAALVGLAVAVPRPAVGAVGFRTFQHNAQRTAIGALLYIADADPPLIITAQELCRNEYTLLKTFLEDRGYVVYARATVGAGATGCAGLDGQIVMAASRGSQVNLLRGPFAHQAPDDGSERSYACVSATVYLLFWWGCSAHLTPNDVLSNVAQSNNMRDIASLINDRAVIVGGDFQRRPYEAGPKDWKPSFHEAEPPPTSTVPLTTVTATSTSPPLTHPTVTGAVQEEARSRVRRRPPEMMPDAGPRGLGVLWGAGLAGSAVALAGLFAVRWRQRRSLGGSSRRDVWEDSVDSRSCDDRHVPR